MKETEKTRQAFAGWWRALQPLNSENKHNAGGDRATLARLRRSTVAEAMADPSVFDLYRRLELQDVQQLPWVATAAISLAFIKAGNGNRTHPARAIGCEKPGNIDKARMKPLRLRKLLGARTPEQVAIQMRRLVQLAEHNAVSPGEMGFAILNWMKSQQGEGIRARWAFEYYRAGESGPVETLPSTSEYIQERQPV
jgi:CRISPR type I-E-associated protein CasB/Cse2